MKKIMEYTDVRQTRGGRYYYEVLLKEQLEKSFQDGIEKGKLEIARKLKEKGFSLKDIAELSGLTLEDLQNNL